MKESIQHPQHGSAPGSLGRLGRGKVVMLVDNPVVPDSRVQKEARSAASFGWQVTLLGHLRHGSKSTWKIGGARVRLLEVETALAQRHDIRRSGWLRSPLAYQRQVQADFRHRLVQAKIVDVRTARAELDTGSRPAGLVKTFASGILMGRRALLAGQRRWTSLRLRRTTKLRERRKAMTSPLDRATTRAWELLLGSRSWRVLDPSLWEWELAYGPVIDKLEPDIIHANDFRMLAVGARAALRGRARGREVKLVWDAHEFLPGIRPWNPHPRWHRAQIALEREYAKYADGVVTVSDELAELLKAEHGLSTRPVVVPNAPSAADSSRHLDEAHQGLPSLRRACGLGPHEPLMVYSGGATHARGLQTAVEALALLPGVHLALVVSKANHASPFVMELLADAQRHGVANRLHLTPYVKVADIVTYLSSADVGLIPLLHYPNHEISLITKFYEYSHARLPIVVSDVKAMSAMVRHTGQGEVFVAEDIEGLAAAVRAVLADPERYRRAYDAPGLLESWTWDAAAEALDSVYSRLMEEKQ